MPNINIIYYNVLFLLLFFSDNKDLNIVSEKFTNIHKTCLSMLQCAAIDTNVVKVIKNLSISMLNACQDSMY